MQLKTLFLIIILFPLNSSALEFVHKDTVLLTDINGITAGRLGRAVGVNQGTVFMSAPEQDGQAGATYEFNINTQRQLDFVRQLSPQDVTPRLYGSAIVTEGDVTAISYSSDDGIEIYTFNAGNWVFSKWITPPTIADVSIQSFGKILDVSGDFLVVGDPSARVGGVSGAGVVMIFGRNTGGVDNWGLITSFLDPDAPEDLTFGASVAISDDLMVVGDDDNDRVFVYSRSGDTWSFLKELQPEDAEVDDRFGVSVEADGNFIAVGATNGNDVQSPSNAGSVHIFQRDEGGSNNFGQVTQLTPSEPDFIDRFGESLRFRQELLVVGAPGAQQAYVFSHLSGEWKEEQKILPPDGMPFKTVEFGVDVDYHNGSLVIGSDRWPDIDGERYGAVFLYDTPYINVGQAGAWFNSETPGQGQLIDVEPESQFMFVSWFTFTDAASANPNEQHWFTAQGNYSGNTADLIVYETLGGAFDDPQGVSTNPVGMANLSFSNCGLGQMNYSIETWNVEGSFPMQRAIPGTENVCQQQAGLITQPLDENEGWDGAWYDINSPGQGFLIDALANTEGDDFIFVAWFTYGQDSASGQRWLTAQGPLQGTTADLIVYETTGGSFDRPVTAETTPVGVMTIEFTDCSHALLIYSLTDEGLAGNIQIERAIPGTDALCQEIN